MSRPPTFSAPVIMTSNPIIADVGGPANVYISVTGDISDGVVSTYMTPFMTFMKVYQNEDETFVPPTQPPLDAGMVFVALDGTFTEPREILTGANVGVPEKNLIVVWAMWNFPDIFYPDSWFEVSKHAFTAYRVAAFVTPPQSKTEASPALSAERKKIPVTDKRPPTRSCFFDFDKIVEKAKWSDKLLTVSGSIRIRSEESHKEEGKHVREEDPRVYIRVYKAGTEPSASDLRTLVVGLKPGLDAVLPDRKKGSWTKDVTLPADSEADTKFVIIVWFQSPRHDLGYVHASKTVTVTWMK